MYFLIASGLSLIYGLMGVLNFAHGAFLTVGAYAHVVHGVEARRASRCCRVPARRARRRSSSAAVFAALVELVLIRPLYGRHIEQVLVTVGLALAIDGARRRRSGATTRASSRRRAGSARRRRSLGAHIPNDRWIEIVTAVVVLFALERVPAAHALRADHPRRRREPRDGDGARHRRAHGLHARLRDRRPRRRDRRRALGRLLRHGRPAARHVAR